jgi:hypothetical protein
MRREIRPRFEITSEEDLASFMGRMSLRLRASAGFVCGVAAAGRVELYVPPSRQRLWSPELVVEVRATDEGTVLEGRYGPHPHVWVGYAALFAVVAVGITASLVFAFAEWTMKVSPVALYALGPLALVGAILYVFAFVGQGLAADQMDELRAFLDEVVYASAPVASGVRNRVPVPEAVERAG